MAVTSNKIGYAGSATLACTQTSLASGSTRESAVYTNSSSANLNQEVGVAITFTIASGSPTTNIPTVNIYANGSIDASLWPIIQLSSGATFSTGGGDASVGALGGGPRMIGSVTLLTTSSSGERTFRAGPFPVSPTFGFVPSALSIMVENSSGVAFSTSTATTAQLVEIQPIYTTSGN
jgi:hypothetical protein